MSARAGGTSRILVRIRRIDEPGRGNALAGASLRALTSDQLVKLGRPFRDVSILDQP
jgi:hypothetical protein